MAKPIYHPLLYITVGFISLSFMAGADVLVVLQYISAARCLLPDNLLVLVNHMVSMQENKYYT